MFPVLSLWSPIWKLAAERRVGRTCRSGDSDSCREIPFRPTIRVAALQKRWDRLRAGLDLILQQRGAEMPDIPGGASGLLVRDYRGKNADRLMTRIDPGVVSLLANSAATSARPPRNWASGRPASRSASTSRHRRPPSCWR